MESEYALFCRLHTLNNRAFCVCLLSGTRPETRLSQNHVGLPGHDISGAHEVSKGGASNTTPSSPWEAIAANPLLSARIFSLGLFALCLWVIWRMAFLCDDAIITLNQAVRFTEGAGITWNSGERVQAFTHPGWFLILSAAAFFGENIYLTTLAVSFLFSGGAFLMILLWGWRAGLPLLGACVMAPLLCVLPFMEFTSSGLETPLSYFTAAGFALSLFALEREDARASTAARLLPALFAAGLVMARFDHVMLVGPIMLLWLLRDRRHLAARYAIICLPVICWLIFSLFYFGLLFPVPYYAKQVDTIPLNTYLYQGFLYFLYGIKHNPATFLVIAAGVAAGFSLNGMTRALSAGALLYLAYLLKIGGDWMAGRMFIIPVLLCVLLAAHVWIRRIRPAGQALIAAACLPVFFMTVFPVLHKEVYGTHEYNVSNIRGSAGIWAGLHSPHRAWPAIAPPTGEPPKGYLIKPRAGISGMMLPDTVYHMDPLGLASPFIAFLPPTKAYMPPNEITFRAGHIIRQPAVHLGESMVAGREDSWMGAPELEPLYRDIFAATHKPLLSRGRLGAIYRLNFARNYPKYQYGPDDPLRTSVYTTQYLVKCSYETASKCAIRLGQTFEDSLTVIMGTQGVEIAFDAPVRFDEMRLLVDQPMPLVIEILRDGITQETLTVSNEQGFNGIGRAHFEYLARLGKAVPADIVRIRPRDPVFRVVMLAFEVTGNTPPLPAEIISNRAAAELAPRVHYFLDHMPYLPESAKIQTLPF